MGAVRWPDHLLTLDEWDGLADDVTYRWAELVEGVLQMSPAPSVQHQRAMFLVAQQLESALTGRPAATVCDIDVVLTASFPPTVRQPDVVVVPTTVLDWIVDLADEPVALDAFALTDGRYEPVVDSATGRVSLERPFPVTVDLDALLP